MLVYAFDASAGRKHAAAAQLIARLWDTGALLWTDDLNDGQLIGGVRIRDPFAG